MSNLLASSVHFYHLMRLDKPIGIFLLLWPTLIALWMAGNGSPDPHIILIFVLGVIVMRSAGCVINDLADHSFDAHVERTQQRPLVTGKLSRFQAIFLLTLLLSIALALSLQLNRYTQKLSLIALLLAIIYPFMKRYTYFPQVILGAAFGFAVPMAFAAQLNHLPPVAWILFSATLLWVVAFDTQYAMVDRKDDLRIGIKSTAIIFGHHDRLIIPLLQILSLMLFTLSGLMVGTTFYFYGSLLLSLFIIAYQSRLICKRDPTQCFKAFLNNNLLGACLFLGLLFDYYSLKMIP